MSKCQIIDLSNYFMFLSMYNKGTFEDNAIYVISEDLLKYLPEDEVKCIAYKRMKGRPVRNAS